MSEISDAVQIIRVGYDTIEIAMKVGSGSIEMMQKAVNLLIGLLEHEKTMGKTNLKGLLEKGGDMDDSGEDILLSNTLRNEVKSRLEIRFLFFGR